MKSHSPTRRDALRFAASTAAALAIDAKSLQAASAIVAHASPGAEEGPYWVEELLNRSDIRSDPKTQVIQPGVPLKLAINVAQLKDGQATQLPKAFVDLWHCNAAGLYSDEQNQNTVGQKYLRGFQRTDASGNVNFVTIYPGWYGGRTTHIHARIRLADAKGNSAFDLTTQMFFDDAITDKIYATDPYNKRQSRDTRNSNDHVYAYTRGNTTTENGNDLLLKMSDDTTHADASIQFVVDLSTSGSGQQNFGGPSRDDRRRPDDNQRM